MKKILSLVEQIFIVILALVIFAGSVTLIQAVKGGYFAKIYYETSSWDNKITYELVDVIYERGEVPVYKVEFDGKIREVTEDVWETYLGKDYNTVTYHVEEITLYKSTLYGLTRASSTREFKRGSYPWEDPVQPFSDEDARTLVNDIYANGGWNANLFLDDSAVEFSTSGHGRSALTYPYDGLTKCANPKVDWWWNWFL